MSKNAQKMEGLPVLGCSRTAPYTRADFSKDLQVYHLTSQHHPNNLYAGINQNFMNSIEVQHDPANSYTQKMKSMYMQELDHSLNQYKEKMGQINMQNLNFQKQYKENVNSMVLSMEKEDLRRHQALVRSLRLQEERGNRFVDADKIKNKKIQNFIQSSQYNNSLKIARSQLQQNHIRQSLGQPDFINIKKLQRDQVYLSQKSADQSSRSNHANEANLMYASYIKMNDPGSKREVKPLQIEKGSLGQRVLRLHNPITNPIQYHIDNPYLISKLQRRQYT